MMPYWRKSSVLRKAAALAAEPARRWRAWRATEDDYRATPPVICNSFPKSGTHLLVQVLEALPRVHHRGAFLASMPSITFRERSPAALVRRIGHIGPGELIAAHLHHHPDCAVALAKRHAVHFFIYRDLRDVAVSEAHYLTRMNRWHRLHRYYRALPDDAARITWAITGEKRGEFPYDYPDIAQRFARFAPWLKDERICAVRFEELVGDQRREAVRRIVAHYFEAADLDPAGLDAAVERAVAAINPARSHTFRAGKAGGWRSVFTPEHSALMHRVAGPLLVELGYESTHSTV